MNELIEQLAVYLYLARASDRRSRQLVSDRLYLLAGELAVQGGWLPVAAYCRQQILQHNPHHLLQRWPTIQAARGHEDYESLLALLIRRYPLERAEMMLQTLGVDRAAERQCYDSDQEYAASLCGMSQDEMERRFGP